MTSNISTINYLNEILKKFLSGEHHSAINKLEIYVKENPKDTTASYNLARMYQEVNQTEKSIAEYLKVIKNNRKHWQSLSNLGLIYFTKKKYKESNKYHFEVLKIKKNYQPSLRDIGTNNLMLGNYGVAESFLTKAIHLNKLDYINLNSLGLAKMRLGKEKEAKTLYEKAIAIKKDYHPSYNNLGLYFDRVGDKDTAFKYFKLCLNINPNYPNALNNIGLIYFYYEKNKKAFECFNKALKIDPNMIDLYFNVGHTYFKLGNFKEAEKWFSKGFNIDPENKNGHYNYSFMLLAKQEYKLAWEEFEYRLKRSEKINENFLYKDIKHKLWKNQNLKGKKVLVVKEQGIGDEILYSSMYKELFTLNKNIIIESDPRLIKIFNRSNKLNNFVPTNQISQNKKELKKIDIIIFAGSLGRLFRQDKNDFPKRNSYLIPDSNLVSKIKDRLNNYNNKPKIGISWFSKNKRIGGGKSISLKELSPILTTSSVSFINLQYDDHTEEINKFNKEKNSEIINLKDIDKFNDIENLAALLQSLDLFITVSNTTAHLSGALGKETWVMAPKNDSLLFYWNTGSNKTPWYPKVKIFPKKSGWNTTINDIKKNLDLWLKNYN